MKPAKNQGMVSGRWWALLRGPSSLPVLFSSRQDAIENRDTDEYLVEVRVSPASLVLLLRGAHALLERRKAQGKKGTFTRSRPRVPDTEKRRRGSMVKVSLSGVKELRAKLKAMEPAVRKRFADAMNGELEAIGWDLAKGKDRTAEMQIKRGRDGKLKLREVKRAAAPRVRR